MKYTPVFFAVIIFLSGCSRRESSDSIIISSLKRNVEFSSQVSATNLNLIELQYNINPEKVRDFYQLSRRIDSLIEEFKHQLVVLSDNKSALNAMIIEYKNVINEINTQIPDEHYSGARMKRNEALIEGYQDLTEEELKLILISEINMGQRNILNYIFSLTHSYAWKFDRISPSTKKLNQTNNKYSFTVNSEAIQQIDRGHRVTTIDTLQRNDVEVYYPIKSNSIDSYYLIELDSLVEGHYYISGKTKYIMDNGTSFSYPFHHEFDFQ